MLMLLSFDFIRIKKMLLGSLANNSLYFYIFTSSAPSAINFDKGLLQIT